jgi:hypothetical protein
MQGYSPDTVGVTSYRFSSIKAFSLKPKPQPRRNTMDDIIKWSDWIDDEQGEISAEVLDSLPKKPYNHRDNIRKWYENVLGNALAAGKISVYQYALLCKIAEQMVRDGRLRGDISAAFVERGFGLDKLKGRHF